jgi:hypothetical protein
MTPDRASLTAKQTDFPRERRSGKRTITVYRLAKLLSDREELCLVRNISPGGLMAEVFSGKTAGDALSIDLGDDAPRPVTVAWTDGDSAGFTFSEPIDVEQVLANTLKPGSHRTRPIRLATAVDVTLLSLGSSDSCRLIDISQGGAKLSSSITSEIGDPVRIDVAGLGRLSGTVRWMRDGQLGVIFTRLVSYRQLARWLAMGSIGSSS